MKPFVQYPALRKFQVHRDLAVIVLVVIGCAVPFLTQPFHMDDNFYMDLAHNVRIDPLYPYSAPYDFGGLHAADTASHSHPPLHVYFLALMQRLAGEGEGREWIYHSVALAFPLLAVVSFYFVCALFVERPIWPALALAVCPLLQVMEHTLMMDVPMLAYWLAGTACFLWAVELDRRSLYGVSAFFLFAAMFNSYQSVALVPLLGYYLVRKKGRGWGWISLLLPMAVMAVWITISSIHYGRMIFGETVRFVQARNPAALSVFGTKLLALFEYQGWLIVFPLFLIYILARGLKGRLLGLALLVAVYFAQVRVPSYRLVDKAIFVLGLTVGVFITAQLFLLLAQAFRREAAEAAGFGGIEAQFLVLWYFGVATYCLVLFAEGSARYVLPLVPPVLISYFRRLEIAETTEYRATSPPLLSSAMVASGSLVLSLALGLFLAQADFEFARIYPRAAASFARMFPGLDSYLAGEWGFRYYFRQVGAMVLPADETTVIGGSLIVKPVLAMPFDLPGDLDSMTIAKPLAQFSFDLKTPFRTMDVHSPAGFYSTHWGLLPFSLSTRSQETLEIRQVSYMIERLPFARIQCTAGVLPWPGYVRGGDRGLAVLAKPGTTIIYPWTFRRPMLLALKIGIEGEDAASAKEDLYDFGIIYRGPQGRILAHWEKTLEPGYHRSDIDLQLVNLDLPAGTSSGETLEFTYRVRGTSQATGAFAEAFVTPW